MSLSRSSSSHASPQDFSSHVLLQQLLAERCDPVVALGRIAAFHAGASGDEPRPLRTTFVRAGSQTFPNPRDVEPLVTMLLVRSRVLFARSRWAVDDFHVAAFLLWGIAAIHPFEDGNGRVAVDFVQYVLMIRWRTLTAPLSSSLVQRLDRVLQPVFAAREPKNDGTPAGHLRLVAFLVDAFTSSTLETLADDEHLAAAARVIASSLHDPTGAPALQEITDAFRSVSSSPAA
jgi:hypothetical protein